MSVNDAAVDESNLTSGNYIEHGVFSVNLGRDYEGAPASSKTDQPRCLVAASNRYTVSLGGEPATGYVGSVSAENIAFTLSFPPTDNQVDSDDVYLYSQ
ncbi:hypothetical protein O9993_00760 [Vibrio lentus]|nr:hypothetical protein [Vibrio lentus]